MSRSKPSARFSSECAAPVEVLYDLLANIPSHLEWGGARQPRGFRLLSLEAPAGRAGVGAEFSSTGSIPMSMRRWQDHSTVTVADRGSCFEFTTQASAGSTVASYRHRYEMVASPTGCRVTYTLTQEAIAHPMLRLALPGIRGLVWRVGIPMFAGRGFRNLLLAAAQRATRPAVASDPA